MEEQLSSRIYRQLQTAILSREIDNMTILTENEIAQKFNVSKAPVRDALHLLCAQGYLISYPRKGYIIRTYSNAEIRKLQVVRTHIERLSISLAVKNAFDDEIRSLNEFLKPQEPEIDPEKTNNYRFHMRLAEISGNEYVPSVLRELIQKICIAWLDSTYDIESHRAIVDALLKRDEEKALAALEYDLNHA